MEEFYSVVFDTKTLGLTCQMKRLDGKIRKISVTKQQKNKPCLPPLTWFKQVKQEIDHQQQEELMAKKGRKMPSFR